MDGDERVGKEEKQEKGGDEGERREECELVGGK